MKKEAWPGKTGKAEMSDSEGMPVLPGQASSGDVLPDDLDVTKYVGPYQFPTPRRRRNAAVCVAIVGISTIIFGATASNAVMVVSGVIALVTATFIFCTAWPLNVNDLDALTHAAAQAPFSVGHASAQLSFYGWLSKPMWRVVVFSSDDPPSQRGMVEINAVTSDIASTYFDFDAQEGESK